MTVLTLAVLGWLAGLLAYLAALGLLYGEWISSGDFWSVVFSSLIAFALCYWVLYLPILRLVRFVLRHPRWNWVFPIVGMLIGVVPTALIARFWGGSFRPLLTPEAGLFLILFVAVGLVVGYGFTRLAHRTRA
jgi:hypothetical protein